MAGEGSKYSRLFSLLEETLNDFILEVNKKSLKDMVTTEWSVKDVLCHVVFWHSYYANNYLAVANKKEPVIFTSKGGSARNQEGVDSLKNKTKVQLLDSLLESQETLNQCIITKGVSEMNYTDRKKYKTEEFLEEIIRHIKSHTKKIAAL